MSKSDLIDIAAELRMVKGKGTAIFDGATDKHGREKWTWLPTSLVENNEDGTFTMPEWLALDKGLI